MASIPHDASEAVKRAFLDLWGRVEDLDQATRAARFVRTDYVTRQELKRAIDDLESRLVAQVNLAARK